MLRRDGDPDHGSCLERPQRGKYSGAEDRRSEQRRVGAGSRRAVRRREVGWEREELYGFEEERSLRGFHGCSSGERERRVRKKNKNKYSTITPNLLSIIYHININMLAIKIEYLGNQIINMLAINFDFL